MRLRMFPQTVTILGLALILAVPTLAQDWRGTGRAHGKILTEEGEPVEGATVELHPQERPEAGPEPTTTDEDGRWKFGGLAGGIWVVKIDAEGFIPSQGTFRVDEFRPSKPLEVHLERDPFAAVTEGQQLIDEGRYEEARSKLDQALPDMEPRQQAQIRALIGTTYYQEGNYAKAEEAYEKAIPGLEGNEAASVQLRLGDSYLQQEKYEEARGAYEASLDALDADGRAQVLVAIARSHDHEGDRDEAIASLERLLEQDPDNVNALQLIADLLSRAGREEEAQSYLDQVPETEALPVDMLLNQGIRFYNQQRLDEALKNFDRVINQEPDLPDAYYYRGLVYLNQGQHDLAAADFRRLLELAPDGQYSGDAEEFLEFLEAQ